MRPEAFLPLLPREEGWDEESNQLPSPCPLPEREGQEPRVPRGRQGGFALVLAVFVITILAALGGYILTVGGVQHQTAVLTLQEARALNAARSGIEWGAYSALNGNCKNIDPFPSSTSALSAFVVTVTCTPDGTHTIRGKTIDIYTIDATATNGELGTPDYVSRHVRTIIND